MNKIKVLMAKRKITLNELYQEKLLEPSPAKKMVDDLVKATGRSAITVRLWINGKFKPEPLVQEIIAKTLNLDVNTLFPNKK